MESCGERCQLTHMARYTGPVPGRASPTPDGMRPSRPPHRLHSNSTASEGSAVRAQSGHPAPNSSPPSRGGLWRNHPALMVALTYGVIGIIYIALSDQVVSFVVQHDESRVTAIQTWKGWAWIVLTTFLILFLVNHSIREVRAAQRESSAMDARYRTMIETTNEGVVLADSNGVCQYVNQTMAAMLGATPEEIIGERCGKCATVSHRPLVEHAMSAGLSDGPERFDCEFLHHDGSSVWTIVSAAPVIDPATRRRSGTLFMVTDITARKLAERALERNLETQRGLLNELDHRVRNNLSSLSSLIDLTRSATGDVNEFASMMSGRVQAMAKAHALAGRGGNEGLDCGRIIAEMIPYAVRSRVSIEGPRMMVDASQIVSFAILLHEIASRSMRSGALSIASGRVVISWTAESSAENGTMVALRWWESPVVTDAVADEHADALISGLVHRDLRGRVATSREHEALVHDMKLALGQRLQPMAP